VLDILGVKEGLEMEDTWEYPQVLVAARRLLLTS